MSDRKKFNFTQYWFESRIPSLEPLLKSLASQRIDVLEIGAFEGGSTTWFLEELLTYPASKMVVIDTFRGSVEHLNSEKAKGQLATLEERFYDNVNKTGKMDQLTVMKSSSYDALVTLNFKKTASFDFIYIDGSHLARDVIGDAVLSWPLLKPGGIMIFDDYEWGYYKEEYNNPKLAIDSFLRCFGREVEIVSKNYQLAIKKVVKESTFTITARKPV